MLTYHITLPDTFETCDLRTLLQDKWLIPRKVRHYLRMNKQVLVNDVSQHFHENVHAGDLITIHLDEKDYPKPEIILGDREKIIPLYEDEHLLIVDKPVKMKTHPNQPDENDTLLNHVASYLADEQVSPYIVHRLDKETSGVIMLAKSPLILPVLGRMLENKEIRRTYQAVASGKLNEPQFVISKPIGRDRHDKRKRRISERGQEAITHVSVLKTSAKQSEISCQLETGRTHQIRVHLASIGHPIIGDPLYHPKSTSTERLALHAKTLSFKHPFTDEVITVDSPFSLY